MPNTISVIPNKKPADYFVNPTSRYANSTPIFYGKDNLLTYKIYKRAVPAPSPTDKYTVITPGWEFRPDLVSMKVYGIPDYWYVIMEANLIFDIMDFKAGTNIRLPEKVT